MNLNTGKAKLPKLLVKSWYTVPLLCQHDSQEISNFINPCNTDNNNIDNNGNNDGHIIRGDNTNANSNI